MAQNHPAVLGPVQSSVRRLALAAACLLAAGCGEKAIGIDPTNNAAVNVERLFDHDGCTVYRFHDYGHPRYYVRCRDQPARTEWTETYQCGKSQCSRAQSVPGA